MSAPDEFFNPLRPIYEYYAVATWAASSLLSLAAAFLSPYPSTPFYGFAAAAAAMALWRGIEAWRMARIQRRFAGQPLAFIRMPQLKQIVDENPGKVFLGWGFEWGRNERQLTHTVLRADPRLAIAGSGELGQRWIHGLGEEDPIFIPEESLKTHVFALGATRAGKSKNMILFICQAILRGEPVVVLDPKNDLAIPEAMREALRLMGREDRMVYLNAAHPEQSHRISPTANFNTASELATRIAGLVSQNDRADNFSAFGMMALNNIIEGLLMVDKMPTLMKLRSYIEGGIEGGIAALVIDATRAYCEMVHDDDGWKSQLKRMTESKETEQDIAKACVRYYNEFVRKHKPSPELEGLYASFTHNAEHARKMLTALTPVLVKLTAGHVGRLLSPDPTDIRDERPITDLGSCIRNSRAVYVGLNALTSKDVAVAAGSIFIADLTSVAGDRYNYEDLTKAKPWNIFIDEAHTLISSSAITLLNQSGGALARLMLCSQSIADWETKLGGTAPAHMALANLTNVIAFRTVEPNAQEWMASTLAKTYVTHIEYAQSSRTSNDAAASFGTTAAESLKETEVELFPPPLLGCFPNLEFLARMSAGTVRKGRTPILLTDPA